MNKVIEMTVNEWVTAGEKLFGRNMMLWKFSCPVCGYTASVSDYINAGANKSSIGKKCIGCFLPSAVVQSQMNAKKRIGIPCNHGNGSIFSYNPIRVKGNSGHVHYMFDFDEWR